VNNFFTWLIGIFVVPDQSGHERLLANYLVPGPNLVTGVARFNDASQQFERVFSWTDQPVRSYGQGFKAGNAPNEYVHFANEQYVNTVRARATAEALEDPLEYEAFSPLRISEGGALELDRGEDGSLRYAWRHGAPPIADLTSYGQVSAEEAFFGHMRDPRPEAKPFGLHQEGSTAWNEHRKRFVQIIRGWGTSGCIRKSTQKRKRIHGFYLGRKVRSTTTRAFASPALVPDRKASPHLLRRDLQER
jgi:hypothetical protein